MEIENGFTEVHVSQSDTFPWKDNQFPRKRRISNLISVDFSKHFAIWEIICSSKEDGDY